MSVAERIAPPVPPRLLRGMRADGRPTPLRDHVARYGLLPDLDPRELRARVAQSGLTGRGGAAFPTGMKLESVAGGRRRPIVLANGAEGEPASSKDKALLAYVPHLVIDGAVLAARAVGAHRVVVAVTAAVSGQVERALAERAAGELVGVSTLVVPDRFIAGEETALVQFTNGGPAVPTFTPPRPFERGVDGAPTLVLNVETLAHLSLVARYGADWFRSIGTTAEPGTALVTVTGAVRHPGVYEVELGSPFAALLAQSEVDPATQAYLVGGYFGTWLESGALEAARVSNADLAGHGAALGARSLIALPAGTCGVVETARILRYLANESAGQCGPCVHGLAAVADTLARLVRRDRRAPEIGVLRRQLAQIAGRGACRHPDGAVALAASALMVFADEFNRHLQGKRCTGHGRAVLPIP